ncbi:MAG: hypothetical protein KDF24_00500 [Rhodocyclaceae bacterium]|nr:hypothetical protein [Rhodocyclaceae bacterium]MCB1961643.1 hypothetical protein [Rhodocyclaceae bacterium]
MRKSLARQRLIACTVFAAVLFNAPLLWLFDAADLYFWVPQIYLYVFGVWAVLIAVLAWIVERA